MIDQELDDLLWEEYIELVKEEGGKNVLDEIDYDCVCYDAYWLWKR